MYILAISLSLKKLTPRANDTTLERVDVTQPYRRVKKNKTNEQKSLREFNNQVE